MDITITGIPKEGKSTVARMIAATLEGCGINVVVEDSSPGTPGNHATNLLGLAQRSEDQAVRIVVDSPGVFCLDSIVSMVVSGYTWDTIKTKIPGVTDDIIREAIDRHLALQMPSRCCKDVDGSLVIDDGVKCDHEWGSLNAYDDICLKCHEVCKDYH